MKINEGLSVLFLLYKAKKSKDGMVPIYVRVTMNGNRDNFSSGKKIDPKDWDEKNNLVKPSCIDYKAINSYIRKTQSELEKHYDGLSALNKEVTAQMVTQAHFPKPIHKQSLLQAVHLHNSLFADLVRKKKGSIGTLKRYERLEVKVKSFLMEQLKQLDIALDDIKYSTAADFYHYLLMKDLDENTAMKYVKTLKQVIKKAVDQGWIKYNAIAGFKCTYIDPDRDYLEMDEIITIYEKNIPIPRLAEVRDVYIFCCFTGYAYETLYNLEQGNIFKGIDNNLWITKDRAKSGTEETVPLLPIALEIIKRYKDHPYCRSTGKLLPINSNQRYNAYLKEIAVICNINKHLTTHTARHTFATTVTLENDVPIETVSKMLGHKDIRTTQIYARITKRKMSNNMNELRNRIFNSDGMLEIPVKLTTLNRSKLTT